MWRPLRAAGATPKPHAAAQWGQALERWCAEHLGMVNLLRFMVKLYDIIYYDHHHHNYCYVIMIVIIIVIYHYLSLSIIIYCYLLLSIIIMVITISIYIYLTIGIFWGFWSKHHKHHHVTCKLLILGFIYIISGQKCGSMFWIVLVK